MDASRKATIAAVGDLLWKLSEIEATVTDFNAGSQEVLEERLLQYAEQLRGLQQLAAPMADVRVPLDLIKHLDNGKDLNQYTANLFKLAVEDNQLCKGKVLAVQQLRETLLAEFDTAWPEHTAQYRSMLPNQPQEP